MPIDQGLLQSQIALAGTPRTLPNRWSNINQSVSSLGDMLQQQYQQRQALQLGIAQQAADAQLKVWAQMQDPIARALTVGKLREEGMNPGNIPQYNIQSMGDLLKGNPYANLVPNINTGYNMPNESQPAQPQQMPGAPGGFNAPPAASPVNPQPQDQSAYSFSPGGQFQQGPFVTPNQKMGPFGPIPSEQTNIGATNEVAGNKSYAEQVGQAQGKQASATTMLDNLTKNLAADLKSHFIEAGGGGPIRGRIAELSTKFGQSPATKGLQNTTRDSAIAYARDLAGGSQGVQRMFQAIQETIPQAGDSQQQAATALLQMHLTATQLNAGMQALGLSPQDMTNMTPAQIQNVMAHGQIDRQTETDKFAQMLGEIQPTKVLDMNGNQSNPIVNPIVAQMFGVKGDASQGNAPTAKKPASQQPAAKANGKFVDGQTYIDAKGNKATYKNGQWIEVK